MSYRTLNHQQTDVLLALYKFRFATRELIAEYQNTSQAYTHHRLSNLLAQEYIGRKYDGKDKIAGKQAAYYLLPKGINWLKQNKELDLNKKVFNLIYKDSKASQQFIDRCLNIFRLYIKLNQIYSDQLTFYSKSEISEYAFFPRILPDCFFILGEKTYWLEFIYASTTYSGLKRRIAYIVDHFESGVWDSSEMNQPSTLLICETAYLERQMQGISKRELYKHSELVLDFYTTTFKALANLDKDNKTIWTWVKDTYKLVSLGDIDVSS